MRTKYPKKIEVHGIPCIIEKVKGEDAGFDKKKGDWVITSSNTSRVLWRCSVGLNTEVMAVQELEHDIEMYDDDSEIMDEKRIAGLR